MKSIDNIPILLLTFNRPNHFDSVLKRVRQVKPKNLFVSIDFPREGNQDDESSYQEILETLDREVDWDCKLEINTFESNQGCKRAVSKGIDWFFENVEYGIILEDDCLPHLDFFPYCAELLDKYKRDERVMSISGSNFGHNSYLETYSSYFFTPYISIWGWATWKRAWSKYDLDMANWDQEFTEDILRSFFPRGSELNARMRNFKKVALEGFDTWDYQWLFTCLMNNGFSIIPTSNLISNIGFDEFATHTTSYDPGLANLTAVGIKTPLIHPSCFVRDSFFEEKLFLRKGIKRKKIFRFIKDIWLEFKYRFNF